LEQYTLKCPDEVLLVSIERQGEKDLILVFKGFSSSLMGATAWDLDIPLIDENATIIEIDRLKSPYNPDKPQYLDRGLTWAQMAVKMAELGIYSATLEL
jgi:hypothetical protein